MKFDDLDKKMRVYETSSDIKFVPNIFLVARLDGRSFTRLTKEVQRFETPFDQRFRDLMVATLMYLMDSGFKLSYGYTQSDEISLLFDFNEDSFKRKERKLNSVLAGEASARFSLLMGDVGVFDSRICQLPSKDLVVDYFRWRNEDANRNALNAYCYWTLRKEKLSARSASAKLSGMSVADKNELLFQRGINFNSVPSWQKRGVGVYWEEYEKEALNPRSGKTVTAIRRRLKPDYKLPMKDEYNSYIRALL